MTLNEVNIIKNAVLDATEAYVDARLSNSPFVKTQIGVVSTDPVKNSNQKYEHTVVCNKTATTAGITYTKVLSVGNIPFPKNSVVFIISPNAQFSNQFILGKLDSSPANILGGEIHIGQIGSTNEYYFNVNNTGNVTIKGADSSIQLAQDGNTGYYHVNLDKNGIKLGHVSANDYNFVVNGSTGNVTIKSGSINLGDNFIVTDAGLVTIKSGSITINNLFKIDTSGNLSIGGTSSAANFYVQSSDGSVAIKKGSITLGNALKIDSSGWLSIGGITDTANFYVDNTGKVTCKDFYANLGGEIAGWTINSNGFSHGTDAWVEPNKISCGSHGSTLVKMLGGSGGYLSVEVNDYMDWIRVYYNSIEKLTSSGSDYVAWQSQLSPSDRKLKTDIIDLDLKTSKQFINNLLPKQYEFIPNKDRNLVKGKRYGFIAQDVEKIIDDDFNIVYEDSANYKHLNYDDIIAPLVKVVQNQQKEIDMLKRQLGV